MVNMTLPVRDTSMRGSNYLMIGSYSELFRRKEREWRVDFSFTNGIEPTVQGTGSLATDR